MRGNELDEALARLAQNRIRPLPSDFEANVWRAIRRRHAGLRGEPSILENFLAILLRPAGALAAAAVTLATAISSGMLGNAGAYPQKTSDMSVFAVAAPALPSTLIGQSK